MDKIQKIIILIIILIIIVNVMPKNEKFDISPISGTKNRVAPQQQESTLVNLYNEYYNMYLFTNVDSINNNGLNLINGKSVQPIFYLDDNNYIKTENGGYITITKPDSIPSVYNLKPPQFPIKFVTNTNNGAFKLVDNYIQFVGGGNFYGENSTLTINDDKSLNINYIAPNKLDSKNKFVIVK
jgi:hypothetical protein